MNLAIAGVLGLIEVLYGLPFGISQSNIKSAKDVESICI